MNTIATVAPELVPALEYLPDLDFSHGVEPLRAALAGLALPQVSEQLGAVSCTERLVPGLNGEPDVRVLHYAPPGKAGARRPAVLHFHGGGYVIGAPEMNDADNRALALTHDCVVISVDYRLAPETTWIGSLADNFAALTWVSNSADELCVDPARIAIAGESAGAGHAAMLALHTRDESLKTEGVPSICFMLLDAPMLDDRTGCSDDPHPHTGEFVWTAEKNRIGWGALLGMEPGGRDVGGAPVPARALNLAGLPPTFISVGALDLFLEEDIEWSRRLTRAGVATELHVVPGAYHGFSLVGDSPQALQLQNRRTAALMRAFGGR